MKPGLLKKLSLLCLMAAGLLVSCAAPQVSPTAPAASAAAPTTSLPQPTQTVPAASPTPPPSRAVLAVPAGFPENQLQEARGLLTGLAEKSGLVLQEHTDLQPTDLEIGTRVVVLLAQPDNLDALISKAPAAQFVVISSGDLRAKGNLSVVNADPQHLAFMAGYITTIISPDWRSAGLLPDQPANLVNAFQNGGRYWCGRCIPNYAPVVLFPVASALPQGSALPAWQQAYESLQKNVVQTLYLPAEVSSPELLGYLSGQKVNLVGGLAPVETLKARWAVTLRQDSLSALERLWPDLLAGKGGMQTSAPITFSDVNESLFTPGRQLLAQEVMAGLNDGSIAPLSVAP